MYFKPSRKNPDFGFLPLPSKPAWLKNDHLKGWSLIDTIFVKKVSEFSIYLGNDPSVEMETVETTALMM